MLNDPPFSKFTGQASKLAEPSGQGYSSFIQSGPTWTPCVNLYETGTAYRVCVDLAGVEKDKIDLTVATHPSPRLTIRGSRPIPRSPVAATPAPAAPRSKTRVHRMEVDHGMFMREVDLPEDVDADAISATYRTGLLWIELPKRV